MTATTIRHIARWDLDKTYLRTDFATMRDLVRTAFERADEKRTHPGAGTLLREMMASDNEIHILSGSPEQLRSRLEDKLRLDGIAWSSFTLKPNLKNMLRFRFRAVRDQLGYKLPMLLEARASMRKSPSASEVRESLFGDDAEADAFVYSLYSDFIAGRVSLTALRDTFLQGNVYEDVLAMALAAAAHIVIGEGVERILIHLEGQSAPSDFHVYGAKVVPFYNYLQAALVLFEDTRLEAKSVLAVAGELASEHRFDGEQLGRSFRDLYLRGHLRGERIGELEHAIQGLPDVPWTPQLTAMVGAMVVYKNDLKPRPTGEVPTPNYPELVLHHNSRRKGKH